MVPDRATYESELGEKGCEMRGDEDAKLLEGEESAREVKEC